MAKRLTRSSGYGQTLPLSPVRITGRCPHPLPPYPGGYKFSRKPCRVFVSYLKSAPVEYFSPKFSHIVRFWPLKITGKIPFLPEKSPSLLYFTFADNFEPYLPSVKARADSSTLATDSFEHDSQ